MVSVENGTSGIGGAGYFGFGTDVSYNDKKFCYIGGQGASVGNLNSGHCTDSGGDGGVAGEGGIIRVSSFAKINAYNGDMITNNDYVTEYFEYEYDGTITENKLDVLTRLDSTSSGGEIKFIPTKIFAQDGILRPVYIYNFHWGETEYKTYDYWAKILGDNIEKNSDENICQNNKKEIDNILLRKYSNDKINHFQQGIGSGAGYIELDNGTFEEIENP